MKKRILGILLGVTLSVSLCACGGDNGDKNGTDDNSSTGKVVDNQSTEKVEDITTESTEDATAEQQEEEIKCEMIEGNLVVRLSSKQLINSIKKVTITKDNYSDYFGDYEYVYHHVDKNAFGEVVNEWDEVFRGFNMKKGVCGIVKSTVAFKFLGKTWIDSNGDKWVYEIGKKTKIYDKNGELVREADPVEKEYYYVESGSTESWYDGYECIDAVGEIEIIDLPYFEQYLDENYAEIRFELTDKDTTMPSYEFWNRYSIGMYQ